MMINEQVCFSFACQVLEYHPQPCNEWVTVGDLVEERSAHATLIIGVEDLPCLLSGKSFNIEMITKRIFCVGTMGGTWVVQGVLLGVILVVRVTQFARSDSPRLVGVGFLFYIKFETIW